jgi:hypothetical protein
MKKINNVFRNLFTLLGIVFAVTLSVAFSEDGGKVLRGYFTSVRPIQSYTTFSNVLEVTDYTGSNGFNVTTGGVIRAVVAGTNCSGLTGNLIVGTNILDVRNGLIFQNR